MSSESIPRANILGVGVSAINTSQALDAIDRWIGQREQHYVCVTGVHGIMESQRDAMLKHIHNQAGLVTPDGMPLVWLSRPMGFPWVERVYGPDLMLALCQQSLVKGYRHYFYGGAEGVPGEIDHSLVPTLPGPEHHGFLVPALQTAQQRRGPAPNSHH